MLEVLIVDDESLIRESIKKMVPWSDLGFQVIGLAKHGIDAYESLLTHQPDVVITDVKMPVMDGLQLVEKVHHKYPDIIFVVLSGHSDFEFAKKAMAYGVRHYLLKPCSEEKLVEALLDVKETIDIRVRRKAFIEKSQSQMEKFLPLVKEQFFRDFMMNRSYAKQEFHDYAKLLGVPNEPIRVLLFQVLHQEQYQSLFTLMHLLDGELGHNAIFKTVVNRHVVVILKPLDDDVVESLAEQAIEAFAYMGDIHLNAAYSTIAALDQAPSLFAQTQQMIQYTYYLEAGCVISPKDDFARAGQGEMPVIETEEILMAIRSGQIDGFKKVLKAYGQSLDEKKMSLEMVRLYALELAFAMLRQTETSGYSAFSAYLIKIQNETVKHEMLTALETLGVAIAEINFKGVKVQHNQLVEKIITGVDDHLHEDHFSLKWLASEILFMSPSYLCKLFAKETGENFSQFVLDRRMERAKHFIEDHGEEPVYKIADYVGMGNNPQYFSQVFKKYTGYTPSEYKKVFS